MKLPLIKKDVRPLKREHIFAACPEGVFSRSDGVRGSSNLAKVTVCGLMPARGSPLVTQGGVSGPSFTRAQPVSVPIELHSSRLAGGSNVVCHLNHGNHGNIDDVNTSSAVEHVDAQVLSLANVTKAVRAEFPGITRVEADRVASTIHGLNDSPDVSYAPLFVRLLAIAEAVSHDWALLPTGVADVREIWPNGDIGVAGPNQWVDMNAMITSLENIASSSDPAIFLRSAGTASAMTMAMVAVLSLATRDCCGVAPGLGPNPPGVAGRLRGRLPIYLLGATRKPAAPAAVPNVRFADVVATMRWVCEVTGDEMGFEHAQMSFVRRVHFLSPTVTNLPNSFSARFRRAGGTISRLRVLYEAVRIGAGNVLGVGAALTCQTGLRVIDGGVNTVLLPTAVVVGAVLPPAPQVLEVMRASTDWDHYQYSLTSYEAMEVINTAATVDVFALVGAVAPAAGPHDAGPITWSNVSCESAMPADGFHGALQMRVRTGLSDILATMSASRTSVPGHAGAVRRFLSGITPRIFLSQVYLAAVALRAAADTSLRLQQYSATAVSAETGYINTGDDEFDEWYGENVDLPPVAPRSGRVRLLQHLELMAGVMGVTSRCIGAGLAGATLHPRAVTSNTLVPAAFHPGVAQIFFGERGQSCGGFFQPKPDIIRSIANSHKTGLMAAGWENLMDVDRIAYMDWVGCRTGFSFTLSRRMQAHDADGGRTITSSYGNMAGVGARSSDNFPDDIAVMSCRTWWFADGMPAEWEITNLRLARWTFADPNTGLASNCGRLEVVDRHFSTPAAAAHHSIGGAYPSVGKSQTLCKGWMDEQRRLPTGANMPVIPAANAAGFPPNKWEMRFLGLITSKMGVSVIRDPIEPITAFKSNGDTKSYLTCLVERYKDWESGYVPPVLLEMLSAADNSSAAKTGIVAADGDGDTGASSALATLNESGQAED